MLSLELPAPFAAVWDDVRVFFEGMARHFQTLADVPTEYFINAIGAWRLGHYGASLGLLRDVTLQTHGDLEVALMCKHPDLLLWTGRVIPEGEAVPYTVGFEVSVGGVGVATLDIETLPPLSQAAEHEAALRRYVERAQRLVAASLASIDAAFLEALSVPPQG
jgi:hypothetical protein